MKDFKKTQWEASYQRKENFIFSPKEEVVKFLNRFVIKRTGVNTFNRILIGNEVIKALDFGCGIGRTTYLLKEFGINALGIDISTEAIKTAIGLNAEFQLFEKPEAQFTVADSTILPFDNNEFDIAVADACLDSMYFENAKIIIKELDRTIKKYLYVSLISGIHENDHYDEDVVVNDEHENGTIQSYYTKDKIYRLIEGTGWKVKWLQLSIDENLLRNVKYGRFHAVLEK